MYISPNYTVEQWRVLDFSEETGWQKAIDIFEDRIRGRFLDFISFIEKNTYAGFTVLALDCLLIETLQQFHNGVQETPKRKSKDYFISFLTETSFKQFFNTKSAKKFYYQFRCGILHQAEIKENSRVTDMTGSDTEIDIS